MVHTFAWVGAAAATWWYGDIFRVLTVDPRLNMLALRIGLFAVATLGSILLYLAGYQGMIRGIKDNYMDFAPRLIYTATAALVTAYVTLTVAVWPVWGWLSLAITTVNLFAFFFLPNLVPDFLFAARNRED